MANNDNPFFPERVARIPFLIRYIIFFVTVLFGNFLLRLPDHLHSSIARIVLLLCALVVLLSCAFCLFRSILIPRLIDAGVHGGWSLVIFVPFVNILFLIALLFIPSDAFIKLPSSSRQ
jgi:uncharacterized membrane protein YhaH (DUF805 family)